MKKARKVLAVVLAFVLTATLSIAGTIAYLTDTDKADNVFTIGNVEIELVEQQRAEDDDGNKTTTLEDFADNKVLLPIVGSAQEGEDALGLPTAENWVDKIVDVKNTGTQSAWVRVLVAFPVEMDAASASDMMLHWNIIEEGYNWTMKDTGVQFTHTDEKVYNIYSFTYNEVLTAGSTTDSHAIIGVYIDSRVDATVDENGNITYFMPGTQQSATFAEGTGPQLLVFAQAVQSAGFDTADEAFTTAAMSNNPFVTVTP